MKVSIAGDHCGEPRPLRQDSRQRPADRPRTTVRDKEMIVAAAKEVQDRGDEPSRQAFPSRRAVVTGLTPCNPAPQWRTLATIRSCGSTCSARSSDAVLGLLRQP